MSSLNTILSAGYVENVIVEQLNVNLAAQPSNKKNPRKKTQA